MDSQIAAKRTYRARTETGDPDPVDTHVGQRLRLRRVLLGMSQTDLAKTLGLTFQQVQKYESGANRISASRLYYIAEALDIPVSFFYDDIPQRGGHTPVPGLAEEPVTALAPPDPGREGLEMMRNYRRITDEEVRRGVYELTKLLANRLSAPEEN